MNTVRALERLADAPHSVTELGDALGLSPRSVRRLLARLRDEGYVVQDVGRRRRYRATLRLVALGELALRRAALPRVAAPVLEGLVADGHVTAGLWIAGAGRPVCVASAGSAPGRPGPDRVLAALRPPPDADADAAIVRVLDPRHRDRRCCAYRLDATADADAVGRAAAAVLDRGTVAAALDLRGPVGPAAVARVAAAAAQVQAALAEATGG